MFKRLLNALQTGLIGMMVMTSAFAADPLKIAFVDTGNTGRSMTSAALAQQWVVKHHANISIISRAVNMNPYNVMPEPDFLRLLEPLGIDVSGHRAAQIDKSVISFSDYIFVMSPSHRQRILADYPEAAGKVHLLAEFATGTPTEVLDAYGQNSAFYDKVFKQISELIPQALEKLPKK